MEMEDLEFKIEDGGLWIENRHSRFEDSIMPHLHLTHVFLFILCCYEFLLSYEFSA